MKPILTAAQMREVDRITIEDLGVPARVLMETAGREVTTEILRHVPPGSRVGVVCGTGNNGGDGLVIARLLQRSMDVLTVIVGRRDALKSDALANLVALENVKGRVLLAEDEKGMDDAAMALRGCALVVDAVFGTGLNKEVRGLARSAIEWMNSMSCPVLAVDVPSGLNSDDANVMGAAVRATWTVALGELKRAHLLVPGAEHCGAVSVVDIGIPRHLAEELDGACRIVDVAALRELHQPRALGSHKGSSGHVGVVGGSPGMVGAAIMACTGALRGGAGRVTLIAREHGHPAQLPVEATVATSPAGGEVVVAVQHKMSALVIGPGLKPDDDGQKVLSAAIHSHLPLVLDAGAVVMLAGKAEVLKARSAPTVLTPHPAELAKLLGTDTATVQKDRIGAAHKAADLSGAVVINKGARTVIVDALGHSSICALGHPVLATGGTGDVLAGLVGAVLARGMDGYEAAQLAVGLHARAGELCAEAIGPQGVLATEIAHAIPRVFRELEAR